MAHMCVLIICMRRNTERRVHQGLVINSVLLRHILLSFLGPGGLLAERTHGDGIQGVPASLRHTRPATRGAFYTWWLRLMMACKRYVYAYTYVPWEMCTSICTFCTCVFVCSICNSILNVVSLSPLSLTHTPMHTLQGDSSFSVYTAPCTFHVRLGMNGGPTYCAKVCMQHAHLDNHKHAHHHAHTYASYVPPRCCRIPTPPYQFTCRKYMKASPRWLLSIWECFSDM